MDSYEEESFGTDEDWSKLNEIRISPDKQELTESSTFSPSLLADQNNVQTAKPIVALSFPINCLFFFFFSLSSGLKHQTLHWIIDGKKLEDS